MYGTALTISMIQQQCTEYKGSKVEGQYKQEGVQQVHDSPKDALVLSNCELFGKQQTSDRYCDVNAVSRPFAGQKQKTLGLRYTKMPKPSANPQLLPVTPKPPSVTGKSPWRLIIQHWSTNLSQVQSCGVEARGPYRDK